MHVHPLRNDIGFHNIELHDGFLHYYRRSDTPHCEHQDVADDYMYWLKEQKGISADIIDTGLECNSWVTRPWMYDEMLHPTNWAASRSVDFLRRRNRDKPFFLFTSFVRPHPPFDAPRYYHDMYMNMEINTPPVGEWAVRDEADGRRFNSYYATPDAELQRQSQAGYYACITHLDHQIGRIIQALADDGERDNTFIMFISDHGELLGDHGLVRKALPYRGSAHIPMIVAPHAAMKAPSGTAPACVAELRDVMPTLLEAAGAAIPRTVDGVSLLDAVCGCGHTREYLHGEHEYGKRSNHYIVTETDKYIWYWQTGDEQYFDLAKDPLELHNAVNDAAYASRVKKLKQFLLSEVMDRHDVTLDAFPRDEGSAGP
jgi:arylsulfatase A-like enzyme